VLGDVGFGERSLELLELVVVEALVFLIWA